MLSTLRKVVLKRTTNPRSLVAKHADSGEQLEHGGWMTNRAKKKSTNDPNRIGRRRWARLMGFLEGVMQNGGSERVRVMAGLRLADVLLARDAREQSELRAAARAETRATGDAPDTEPEPVTPETAEAAAARFIESMKEKGKIER
jgi:hypothetical protein